MAKSLIAEQLILKKARALFPKGLSPFFFLLVSIMLSPQVKSQEEENYVWWNPVENNYPVVEGQAWPKEVKNYYDRLPGRAEKNVREEVWKLSHQTAGLMISFMASTSEVVVRYKVSYNKAFPHMSATGVSGVDLYAVNNDGKWLWCRGRYSFGDTITWRFNGIEPNDSYHKKGREYRLYLPLYNKVDWFEVGVPEGSLFTSLPVRKDKPIVVYGTSIVQGACASRPGMAWTSLLGRKLDRPLINLGFSGNGLLEKELIDLLVEIDAKMYVLDCLPNLGERGLSPEEIKNRILASVNKIRQLRKITPILFVEHSGYADALINPQSRKKVEDVNKLMKAAFTQLQHEGVKNIFLLTREEINQDIDCMVDGVHPSDLGMQRYADACEKKIRHILNEPVGILSSTIPCTQNRDADIYDWKSRHNELLSLNGTIPPGIIFIGNSITHYWGGNPAAAISRGSDSWNNFLEPLGARNFGFGWDRIENVLWRVYHDELDGYIARKIVIMVGTNNLEFNSNAEIIEGLKMLINAIKVRQPGSRILMMGLLPRRKKEERIVQLNKGIARLAAILHIDYADAGKLFLNKKGKINELLFGDGLHPNAEGYSNIIKILKPYLK